jgi:WD40 repeat protein
MIRARSAFFASRRVSRLGVGLVLILLMATGLAHGEDAKQPRTDLYGDLLPPGVVMRLGTNRLRHPRYRWVALAFSRDGKHLISCGSYEVRFWDAATGRLVRRTRLAWKPSEGDWHSHASLTPDGTTAAVWGSDGMTKCLYNTATGQERGRLTSASVLAFSPNGKKMAVQCWDKEKHGTVQIWDVAEFEKQQNLDAPPRRSLRTTAFTPDGKRLAALGEYGTELFVWDAVMGKLRQRKKFPSPMASLAYAPDGATLAVGRGGRDEALLFDADTLMEKAVLPAQINVKVGGFIHQLLFSPDGRWLAGLTGEHVAVGCGQYGLVIWELREPARPRWLFSRDYFAGNSEFAFAPDGKKLAYCDTDSDAIDLWDVASGRRLRQPPGHDTPVRALAVSPDGKILASGDYKPALLLWDTVTGKLRRSLDGREEPASTYLFSADGQRMISVNGGWKFGKGNFQVWEAATGKELNCFGIDPPLRNALSRYVETVALSGDGKRLAAVAWVQNPFTVEADILPLLFIWDAATGKQLARRPLAVRIWNKGSAVQKMAYRWHALLDPEGESVTEWRGERLIIEDISTKSLLAELPKDVGDPRVFSADGRLLAAVSLQPRKEPPATYDVKGLSLIETASGQEVARLEIGKFDYVAFTPDSRAVVVADKQKLSVWDTVTGERLHQREWPEDVRDGRGEAKISSLAVLPDGRVATGMTEGDILVWDLATSTWPVQQPARELSRDLSDALWSDLARDARAAYRAVSLLVAMPARSVPLLGTYLHPVAVDSKHIEKLLTDLDDERYEVREAASCELARLRYHAEPMLRRALQEKPTLETRRRIDAILDGPRRPSAEALRILRAITILERIGTPEARRILEKLASGTASPETRAAQQALFRLKYR